MSGQDARKSVFNVRGLPGVGPEWVGHEAGRGLGNGTGEVPKQGHCARHAGLRNFNFMGKGCRARMLKS